MSWLNTDSVPVCHVAILGEADRLPWSAAKVCFEHQIDFNYLEIRHLEEGNEAPGVEKAPAKIDATGVHIAGMHYQVLIIDEANGPMDIPEAAMPAIEVLRAAGRVIPWEGEPSSDAEAAKLVAAIAQHVTPDITVDPPQTDLRTRHVIKDSEGPPTHYYILWNEGIEPCHTRIRVSAMGKKAWIDPLTTQSTDSAPASAQAYGSADTTNVNAPLALTLEPYALRVLAVTPQATVAGTNEGV
jgi:hypothetical protein